MSHLSERGKFYFVLLVITVASAIPGILLGSSQFIEYDGYWHVFIAQQDTWNRFWSDIQVNAHPPLFFLLLKAAIHLGRSALIYRSISLISGAGAVFAVGCIARKVTLSPAWAGLAALAYGLSLPAIIMACEVRSYMLSVFFVLLSFQFFLGFAVPEVRANTNRLRIGFTVCAILACLSHFFAFFYVGGAAVVLVLSYVVRRWRAARASWKAEIITILPVLVVVYILYATHAGALAQIQGHLVPYYLDDNSDESVPSFIWRNGINLVNLFSPFPVPGGILFAGFLAGLLIIGTATAFLLVRSANIASVRAFVTILLSAIMLIAIIQSAVSGKYPFGGDLRQQFLLFPFLVICFAIASDQLTSRLPWPLRNSLAAVAAVAALSVSLYRYAKYPKVSTELGGARMQSFNNLDPTPKAVYLDQFNLILFFIHHHQWQWSAIEPKTPAPGVEIHRLRLGGQEMLVFRDTEEWNADPDNRAVYEKIARAMSASNTREVDVFASRQTPPKAPFLNLKMVRRTILAEAAKSELCPQKMSIDPTGWYIILRTFGCNAPEIKPLQLQGAFDDASEEVDYAGEWTHATLPLAAGGTEASSRSPQASAHLDFVGTEVMYVYSKANNRGVAAVKIDGVARQDIDLYSPAIVWQSKTLFSDLGPGKHTIQISVSGAKNAKATDSVVDVDGFVVR